MKRTLYSLVALLLLASLLPSCKSVRQYRDDLSVRELCDLQGTREDGYLIDSTDFLEDYLTLPDDVTEYAVLYKKETNCLDEIGIFRVAGDNAEHLADLIRTDYLMKSYEKNRTFYDSYMPEETPKLANAEVRVFGSYTVYAILSEHDKRELFDALEKQLTGKKRGVSNAFCIWSTPPWFLL